MANPPNQTQLIVVATYGTLILPSPLHDFPHGDYLKYLPKFIEEGQVIVDEHVLYFYNYSNNQSVEHKDVQTRLFMQSLDGEFRKWIKELPVGSIVGINALYFFFLIHWGDKKDDFYYITKFRELKRKNGESLS